MSARWIILLTVSSALLVGCAAGTPPEKLYPVGAERSALVRSGLEPMKSESRAPNEPPSPRVASALRDRGLEGRVHRYDAFWVPRGALGMGVYWDYVFYDDQDRVVWVMRRVVD